MADLGNLNDLLRPNQTDIAALEFLKKIYIRERTTCISSISGMISKLATDPQNQFHVLADNIPSIISYSKTELDSSGNPVTFDFSADIAAARDYILNVDKKTPITLTPDSKTFQELERKGQLLRRLDEAIENVDNKINDVNAIPAKKKRKRIKEVRKYFGKSLSSKIMQLSEPYNKHQEKINKLYKKLIDYETAATQKGKDTTHKVNSTKEQLKTIKNRRIRVESKQQLIMLSLAKKQLKYQNKAAKLEAKSLEYSSGTRKQKSLIKKAAKKDKKMEKPIKLHGARIVLLKQGFLAFVRGKKHGDYSSWMTRREDALNTKITRKI